MISGFIESLTMYQDWFMELWAKYKQLEEQRGKANLGNKTISEIVGRTIYITFFLTWAYMHKYHVSCSIHTSFIQSKTQMSEIWRETYEFRNPSHSCEERVKLKCLLFFKAAISGKSVRIWKYFFNKYLRVRKKLIHDNSMGVVVGSS